MRKFGVIFGLIALVIATSLGITFWSAMNNDNVAKIQNDEQETQDLEKVKLLIAADKSYEALPIIQKYRSHSIPLSPNSVKWIDLYIKANEKEKNVDELVTIFDFYPESFRNNEDASLIIANEFLAKDREKDYASVRSIIRGNDKKESNWVLLDADYLILQNRQAEAIDLLKSRSFEGKNDVNRLIKLAALKANENQKEAWGYLTDAYNKDPKNVDIRSYRAHLLENGGKYDQAILEYKAAADLLPNNLYLKDQLAEFYVRRKDFPSALNIWKSNLSNLDIIWVKAFFWNKVIQPIQFDWSTAKIPSGSLQSLIAYYTHLNPDQYWDNAAFSKIEGATELLKSQQSTFWLRLLQDLKNHDEKEARNLLVYNPFATSSWAPELETALLYTLNYRKDGVFLPDTEQKVVVSDVTSDPIMTKEGRKLVTQLNNYVTEWKEKNKEIVISKNLSDLLKSNEIFTALFISADWSEAALQFNSLEVIPPQYPQWISAGIVQALARNRGVQQALDFAAKQTTTSLGVLNDAIENASPEARSYMAKKAYTDKNWPKARELTERLIKDYPDNQQLKENLKKIAEQEAK